MFDELEKYKEKDHFFLSQNGDIDKVCNAPDKSGVYLVYSLNRGRIELVYIGCTDLTTNVPGLRDQIISRGQFLKTKIEEEGSDALDIYWYVTNTGKKMDDPKEIELKILQRHKTVFGTIPRWNK